MLPIIRSHLKQPLGAMLIILQIALTLTVISNAMSMIQHRLEKMQRDSGIIENELVTFSFLRFGEKESKVLSLNRNQDLIEWMKRLPYVTSAAVVNTIPFHYSQSSSDLCLDEAQDNCPVSPSKYFGGTELIDTFGLELLEGRNFYSEELTSIDSPEPLPNQKNNSNSSEIKPIIITQAISELYFPTGSPLNQLLYMEEKPYQVIGVVKKLQRVYSNNTGFYNSVILPNSVSNSHAYGAIRLPQEYHKNMLDQLEKKLLEWNPKQVIRSTQTLETARKKAYASDQGMSNLLVSVMVLLLIVTGLGITGLVSFAVTTKRKQIGTRRALGAAKIDILKEFLLENLFFVVIGCSIGTGLSITLNQQLMQHFSVPLLDLTLIAIGVGILFTVSQAAAIGPTRQAMAISPATATRTL